MDAVKAGLPSRQRLADLTEYAIQGAWPRDNGDCTACRDLSGERCAECAVQFADARAFIRISEAISEAANDAGALAIFLCGLASAAGVPGSFARFLLLDALAARSPGAVCQACLAPGQCTRNHKGDEAMAGIYRQILAGIEVYRRTGTMAVMNRQMLAGIEEAARVRGDGDAK